MLTGASAALGSIKIAADMAKGIAALKTETEINQAIIDIQRALLDAQSAATADRSTIDSLMSQIRDLKATIASNDQWEEVGKRYVLTASHFGTYTYDLRPEAVGVEPFHRLCVTCFNDRRKSILHVKRQGNGGEIVRCERCKADFKLSEFNDPIVIAHGYDPIAGY